MEKVTLIKSAEQIKSQLCYFQKRYPNILLISESDNELRLGGFITVHKVYNNFQLYNDYTIEIVIPIASSKLPYIIDTQKYISPNYPHCYSNGILCLETDVTILAEYKNGFDLTHWMNKYVESYFFSYEYYCRYGIFPFGERSHGLDGVLEAYQDLLNTQDAQQTYDIMQFVITHPYRGHTLCPCKSGFKLRNCHGNKIKMFYDHIALYETLRMDCKRIKEAINARDRNKKKTE